MNFLVLYGITAVDKGLLAFGVAAFKFSFPSMDSLVVG
jgi:hypothetical protein